MRKLLYLFTLLALAGCSVSDFEADREGMVPINLTVDMADAVVTRAGTAVQSTQFAQGETFNAYFPSGNTTVTTTTYKTSNTSGATTCTGTQPYFNAGATSTTVRAFYPSSVTYTTQSFTVQQAQNTDANYKLSDLMYATNTLSKGTATTATASMTFNHKLSKIVVNATAGSGVSKITDVRIIGGYRTINISTPATCTLGSSLSNANSTSSYITMYSGGTSSTANCAAIIPPQTINGNFLQIVTDKGTATYALSGKAVASGYVYTIGVTVNAAAVGITTTITDWGSSASLTIQPTVKSAIRPEAVDLGIEVGGKKILFANMNLGANDITDYGLYFMWGDVAGYSGLTTTDADYTAPAADGYNFDWPNYRWNPTGDGSTFTRYTGSDNTELLAEDDAAAVMWGGGWRMPTQAELNALATTYNTNDFGSSNTTNWKWEFQYNYNNSGGHAGYLISYRKNTDNTTITSTLFLPAAGYRRNTSVEFQGYYGHYWSSSLNTDNPSSAWYLNLFVTQANISIHDRYCGCSVRPVRPWYKEVSSATADDLGKIICSNGHIHTNVSDVACGGTAVAMIVYVGAEGSADASSTSYKGLAVALTDASTSAQWGNSGKCVYQSEDFSDHYDYGDMNGIANTNKLADATCTSGHYHAAATAARDYTNTVDVPANCSQWFLPSSGQWFKFLRNSKLNLSWTDWGTAGGGSDNFDNVNKMFTDAGANGAVFSSDVDYWSSSECDASKAVTAYFGSSFGVVVDYDNKSNTGRARAFLAF